ncbi:MAG: hypothetical protein H7141_07760 [Burkholderiales bacterium]|nr:hypothetical protein [Bacteroidia bacterium]
MKDIKIKSKKNIPAGYKYYPSKDDIYSQGLKEEDIDPEDISKNKIPNEKLMGPNEKDFKDDVSGTDLDIPGSELDDEMENIGCEDEENNYYSLGGDNNL